VFVVKAKEKRFENVEELRLRRDVKIPDVVGVVADEN
jgi:hypothetical protein